MTPHVISIGRRRICACLEPCKRAIEYRDISGEVEFTLCEKAAKQLAFQTVDALLEAPAVPEIRKLKTWTTKEVATLKQLLKEGKSQGQIGLVLGRATSTVRKKIHHMRKIGKLE